MYTAQNMKFSIKDFFSKCDQIRSFLRIWSHLLKKSWMENLIFCAAVFAWSKQLCLLHISVEHCFLKTQSNMVSFSKIGKLLTIFV